MILLRKNEYDYWGLGAIVKSLAFSKLRNNFDFHIAVTGIEGSGKSALAIALARFMDRSFNQNMNERMYFSNEALPDYLDLLNENVEKIENGFEGGTTVIFDETQNIFNRRNAPTKENKALLEVIRTQRMAKMCCIYATPNVLELENFLSNRMDVILFCSSDKKKVYGVTDTITYDGKVYNGSKNLLFQEMKNLDPRTLKMSPENIMALCMDGKFRFDFGGKTVYDDYIYNKYSFIKAKKTSEFFNNTKEKINKNKPIREEEKESKYQMLNLSIKKLTELENDYIPQHLEKIEDEMFEDDFISQKAIANWLDVGDGAVSKKIDRKKIEKVAYQGKKYIKVKYLRDLI